MVVKVKIFVLRQCVYDPHYDDAFPHDDHECCDVHGAHDEGESYRFYSASDDDE